MEFATTTSTDSRTMTFLRSNLHHAPGRYPSRGCVGLTAKRITNRKHRSQSILTHPLRRDAVARVRLPYFLFKLHPRHHLTDPSFDLRVEWRPYFGVCNHVLFRSCLGSHHRRLRCAGSNDRMAERCNAGCESMPLGNWHGSLSSLGWDHATSGERQ